MSRRVDPVTRGRIATYALWFAFGLACYGVADLIFPG